MSKPWIEEQKDDNGSIIKTTCMVATVEIPPSYPGKVPAGEIVPVGGAFNPSTGDIVYPVGYFVRPLRPGDREAMKRLGQITKKVQRLNAAPDDTSEQAAEDALLEASEALGQLIEMAFLPYYGTAKTNEIKEQFTFSAMSMLLLVEALKSNEVWEITCVK